MDDGATTGASSRQLLGWAAARLREAGVASAQLDSELLLAHVTGRPRLMLRLADAPVDPDDAARFCGLVDRRAGREPLQHLTGRAAFRHLDLGIGPGTFIPRPETELLVDEVLRFVAGSAPVAAPRDVDAPVVPRAPLVIDLCTGSGALALAVATEARGVRVIGVELSAVAFARACANVGEHAEAIRAAASTVEVLHADATRVAAVGGPLAALRGSVDVVLTNPPYIPEGAVPRDPEVRDHDPGLALYAGSDGLDVIRPLARQAAQLLRPGGLLVVEHADCQGEAAGGIGVPGVLRMQADRVGGPEWRDVTDHLDLAGRPRFTTALRARRAGRPGAGVRPD